MACSTFLICIMFSWSTSLIGAITKHIRCEINQSTFIAPIRKMLKNKDTQFILILWLSKNSLIFGLVQIIKRIMYYPKFKMMSLLNEKKNLQQQKTVPICNRQIFNPPFCVVPNSFILMTPGWWTADKRGEHLHVHLLCLLHHLRLLLHPQPLHWSHHWQLQRAEEEDKYNLSFAEHKFKKIVPEL